MKKLVTLIAILISINSFSQGIDSVRIRYLSLKKETWSIIETWFPRADSLGKKTYGKIEQFMKDYKNASNNTQIVFDSLPGRIAIDLYDFYKTAPSFITDKIGSELITKLAAYPPLQQYIVPKEQIYTNQFQSQRKSGEDGWF